MKKIFILTLILLFFTGQAFAEKIIFSGKVIDAVTKGKVEFASIALLGPDNKGIKTSAGSDGRFKITIPVAGKYIIIIRSTGLKPYSGNITIRKSTEKNFILAPMSIRGRALTVRGERDIQKISRRTMTVEDLKETPASFGDAISALASLPGVVRVGGFFGPLVIRGASSRRNRYFIDGVPINDPMHFGGLHSVISNNLMSEIDLYSSAFPSMFGGSTAAVISINTLDKVDKFGGFTDIGLLSSSAQIQFPIKEKIITDKGEKFKNIGYIIFSGRVGYLSLFIPTFARLIGQDLDFLPGYWDYQFKAKYFFNSRHSVKFLAIGSIDYMHFYSDDIGDDDTMDPYLEEITFDFDQMFHNASVYYTYKVSRFKNELIAYTSLNWFDNYLNVEGTNIAPWLKDFGIDTQPNSYAVKDNIKLEWIKDIAELRGSVGFTYYDFIATGNTLIPNKIITSFDPTDPDLFIQSPVSINSSNKQLSGFVENKFTYRGLTFIPGIRAEYLFRTKAVTIDPRGMLSYEFPGEVTIAAAGGKYSSFFQTNPEYFKQNPEISEVGDELLPEKAWHSAVSIEKKYRLYTFNVEGFYNYAYDLSVAFPHTDSDGNYSLGQSSGKNIAYGVEVLIKKDRQKSGNDFFGWLSYTYTKSTYRTGIDEPVNYPSGMEWLTSSFEQEHSLKLVAGYKYKSHLFSLKFQLYTSFPYTPIVGGIEDLPGSGRYVPIMSSNLNSEHWSLDHQLDIRYSYQTGYEWGYVKWYVELIDVYTLWYKRVSSEEWSYNQGYLKGENPATEAEGGIPFPNFGVEVKF